MNASEREAGYPEPLPDNGSVLREAPLARAQVESDEPTPEQIAIYRGMTPGRRLEVAEEMYWSARRMKSSWLRARHPDWTDSQVEAEVTRIFTNAGS